MSLSRDRENLPIAMSRANVAGPTVEIGARGGDFSFYLTSKGHALSMFHAVETLNPPDEMSIIQANDDENPT